jgi:putative restriction endonuclease
MPAVSPLNLVSAIVDALSDSRAQSTLLSPLRSHPRRFRVITETEAFDLWVYIWTVTHGGATRSAEEYRIQMTTVTPPLATNPTGPTLLLGWFPELGVFSGFDIRRHINFSPGSNSVQISRTALEQALNFGFGFYTNQHGEIAVAFRPSEFVQYIQNRDILHDAGRDVRTVSVLNRIATVTPVTPDEIAALPQPRQRVVETVSKLVRATNFRDQVLNAYGNRCAVTRAQLKLVDAAHILPVGADRSDDSVRNGIALSPTYHRAFDQGLIYLTSGLRMEINQQRVEHLKSLQLLGGFDTFTSHLNRVIHLPADPNQRPSQQFIELANKFRNTSR